MNKANLKIKDINLVRPHCPKCAMRMIATKRGLKGFECLRCGYTGAATRQQAAE